MQIRQPKRTAKVSAIFFLLVSSLKNKKEIHKWLWVKCFIPCEWTDFFVLSFRIIFTLKISFSLNKKKKKGKGRNCSEIAIALPMSVHSPNQKLNCLWECLDKFWLTYIRDRQVSAFFILFFPPAFCILKTLFLCQLNFLLCIFLTAQFKNQLFLFHVSQTAQWQIKRSMKGENYNCMEMH